MLCRRLLRRPLLRLDEEKLDRRAHWAQWAITGIVLATGWCVRLEFTVAALKTEMEQQKAARDQSISAIWNRFGADHDQVTALAKDIEWLKRK